MLEPWVFLLARMRGTNMDEPCGPRHGAHSCCYFEGVCSEKNNCFLSVTASFDSLHEECPKQSPFEITAHLYHFCSEHVKHAEEHRGRMKSIWGLYKLTRYLPLSSTLVNSTDIRRSSAASSRHMSPLSVALSADVMAKQRCRVSPASRATQTPALFRSSTVQKLS